MPSTTEVSRGRPTLGRGVGIFVSVVVASLAGLLGLAVWTGGPQPVGTPQNGVVLDAWNVLYDTASPSFSLIAAAFGLAVLATIGLASAERVATDRARRSTDGARRPLAPRTVMAGNRGEYAGPVTITVLVPAHNERASVGATLESLFEQSRPPERIIVVADNCSDDTAQVARRHGAEVVETVDNTKKKAGALNQVLTGLLEELGDNDCVMVVDADTVLDAGFLAAAVQQLTDDRAIMSIGGLFYGDDSGGLLAQLQRNEYVRYSRELERRRGRVYVLTGTASIFRSTALRAVADARGSLLPGVHGEVYDTAALTEDNELTLALKSLGALMCSPHECRVVTELMPKWSHLWRQRLRWQRGALENLGAFGFRPALVRYWAQQLGIGYSVIALSSFWLLLGITVLATPNWVWYPFWLAIGGIFVADRVVSVWQGGWRARGLAVLLFPELVYDLFLDVVYVKGVLDITFARQAMWGHVPSRADARAVDAVPKVAA
ncbi:MAG: glycosyltransferase family 2 protein [Acidimicrobiia bacterium]|nr:glycosyltransferase family 2 protein [Acidimicrobiia bacterium]